MPQQQHTCLTCGFLTVRGREISATERQALVAERAPADAEHLRCYLELWDELSPDAGVPDVLREVQTPRTCVGHFAHEPGQSPKQHLLASVQRERRRPRWQVPTVVGVLLVVGTLVARSCIS
jgi:hypothetical protein